MKTTLKISGMSCEHCVKHVAEALKEISGVASAKVSLKHNNTEVKHSDQVTVEAMKAAIAEAGYEVVA
jgi:copper ion binding protein